MSQPLTASAAEVTIRSAHSTALVASGAETEEAWYCDFCLSLSSHENAVSSERPAGPAARSSARASWWLSVLPVLPVSARQMTSLELMPAVTAADAAALYR